MRMREQAVARDRPQGPRRPAAGQIQRDVEGGQARPEHQHGLTGADDVERASDPRVADVPVGGVELGALGGGVCRGIVAERQHDFLEMSPRPIGEGQPHSASVGLGVDDLPDHALEGDVARRAFRLAEEKLQVLAVEPAGDERVRGDAPLRPRAHRRK